MKLIEFIDELIELVIMNRKVYMCDAPQCPHYGTMTRKERIRSMCQNFGRVVYYCPEHLERITAGRISDNDPNTNPDLNNG